MDPFTIVGLAGNVITFIQAGLNTASQMGEVYRSATGTSQHNQTLEQVVTSLESSCNELLLCIGREQDPQRLTGPELALREIAWKCAEASVRLRNLLDRLKAGPRRRDAFLKTIKTKWRQDEISELRREIDDYQDTLNTQILVDLRFQMQKRQALKSEAPSGGQVELAEALKETLWFPSMFSRQEQIEVAAQNTYRWIYDDCERMNGQWDCFRCWLRSDTNLYWINGKAGSGKSTLMKYIVDEPKTIEGIKHWSSRDNSVVAAFFFWSSGSTMERSLEGFLRTLLYQVMQECPEAVATLFPSLSRQQLACLDTADSRNMFWTERKLINAMDHLTESTQFIRSYCFFVDGLDEFAGDPEILIDLINRFSKAEHVKFCISSRPQRKFQDSFSNSPKLLLETLTSEDMRSIVASELCPFLGNGLFSKDRERSLQRVLDDIPQKAEGVFLWVRLVTRKLSKQLSDGDSIESVQKELNSLPSDLHDLFGSMIGRLELQHKEEAATYFRLMFASPDSYRWGSRYSPPLSILDLLFAGTASVASTLAYPNGINDWEALKRKVSVFRRRIEVICCGLVEFTNLERDPADWIGKIDQLSATYVRSIPRLLHRSAQEYLQEHDTIPGFSCQVTQHDYERLIAARIMTMKTLVSPSLDMETIQDLADYALSIARHVEEQSLVTNTVYIDEIDRACMSCARRSGNASWFSPSHMHSQDITKAISFKGVDESGEVDVLEKIDVVTELDIVSYATSFGLLLYAKTKVMANSSLCQRSDKLPILHAAHCMNWVDSEKELASPAYQSLLQTLLESGADPNLKYKGKSAWRLRLDMQGTEQMNPGLFTRFPQEFTTFLNYGADCNQRFDYQSAIGPSRVEKRESTASKDDQDLYSLLQEIAKAPKDAGDSVPMDQLIFNMISTLLENPSILGNTRDTGTQTDENMFRSVSMSSDKPVTNLEDESSGKGLTNQCEAGGERYCDIQSEIPSDVEITSSPADTPSHQCQQNDDLTGTGNLCSNDGAPKPLEEPLSVRPVWRISLLYWATYGVVDTTDALAFRDRLIESGATVQEPFIVKISGMGTGTNALDSMFFRNCSKTESSQLTRAWNAEFPNFTITLLPKVINTVLKILQDGGFLRPGGMLRADELLRASNVITDCLSANLSLPELVYSAGERLRDVDIFTDNGLIRASQIWRTGELILKTSLEKSAVAYADRLDNYFNDLKPAAQEQVVTTLRDEGLLCSDTADFTEDSGLVRSGQSLPLHEFNSLSSLFEDNGAAETLQHGRTTMLNNLGKENYCKVM